MYLIVLLLPNKPFIAYVKSWDGGDTGESSEVTYTLTTQDALIFWDFQACTRCKRALDRLWSGTARTSIRTIEHDE
jgi:hypothetical protein